MAPLSVTSVAIAVILFKWSTTLIGQWRFAAFTVAAMAAANVECEYLFVGPDCQRGFKEDSELGDAFCCQNTQSMRMNEMVVEVGRQNCHGNSRFVHIFIF